MASVQEMLVEDIKEEIEEKIDIQNDFPNLTAISSSDEEHMPKYRRLVYSCCYIQYFEFIFIFIFVQ